MAFFTSAVGTLQTLVIALGAGLGIWGAINLMEGYGNDNPGANFQGITEQTNFYFNEKDELVIAFDEYEVAPGSMGAPEFVIPQEVTAAILK